MTRVAVLGAGSWGTAFGLVLADAGAEVVLWGRREELCDTISRKHENPDYLPGVELPPALWATSHAALALDGAEAVVIAVPSQELRPNLKAWLPLLPPDAVLVSLMKGVELGSSKRMSEVVMEVADVPPERVAVVSGPNLAREIAARQPSACVVACPDVSVAEDIQRLCSTPWFRPYTNTDVVGVELGGAVKNVIALAVGIAEGMGFGDNSKASIITRGLAEMARLGQAVGADEQTFFGLAGLGDLVATCASRLSRNRTVGVALGEGVPLEQASASGKQVAEGVKSCASIHALALRHGVDMPIVEHVVAVVHGGVEPRAMVRSLMSRAAKAEQG